jgi:hypothetical protein
VLTMAIGGTSASQIGSISVSGSATLAGTLSIQVVNGFTPASGNMFQLLSFSSESGTFDTLTNPNFTLQYNTTSVVAVAH